MGVARETDATTKGLSRRVVVNLSLKVAGDVHRLSGIGVLGGRRRWWKLELGLGGGLGLLRTRIIGVYDVDCCFEDTLARGLWSTLR